MCGLCDFIMTLSNDCVLYSYTNSNVFPTATLFHSKFACPSLWSDCSFLRFDIFRLLRLQSSFTMTLLTIKLLLRNNNNHHWKYVCVHKILFATKHIIVISLRPPLREHMHKSQSILDWTCSTCV